MCVTSDKCERRRDKRGAQYAMYTIYTQTYASGGPEEHEGLSPTVRLYSRISMVSNCSSFFMPFLLLLRLLILSKLSCCVATVMQLFFGLEREGIEEADDSRENLTCRFVLSMALSVVSDTVLPPVAEPRRSFKLIIFR